MKPHRPATTGTVQFDERLTTPLWWWLPALLVVTLVYLDVRLGHPRWPAWPVAALGAVLAGVALYRMGRARVAVVDVPGTGTMLLADRATLPVRFIAGCAVVPKARKQEVMGPDLDPRAYLAHKAWIGPLVRVDLDDPADPTPYWLVSVRRPEALVECLRASSRADRGSAPQ